MGGRPSEQQLEPFPYSREVGVSSSRAAAGFLKEPQALRVLLHASLAPLPTLRWMEHQCQHSPARLKNEEALLFNPAVAGA